MRNLDFTTFFEGRITKDATIIVDGTRTSFFFTIAIDDGYKNKVNGEWIDNTLFKNCVISCNEISDKRLNYYTNNLLKKGYKVKGTGEMGEPKVCIDKKTKKPMKDKNGNYMATILMFVDNIKLVAKPSGNPIPTDKAEPTIKETEDDLPF